MHIFVCVFAYIYTYTPYHRKSTGPIEYCLKYFLWSTSKPEDGNRLLSIPKPTLSISEIDKKLGEASVFYKGS